MIVCGVIVCDGGRGGRGFVSGLIWNEKGEADEGRELLPLIGVVSVPMKGITSIASSSADRPGVMGRIRLERASRGGDIGGT